jgi:hypothetical protein
MLFRNHVEEPNIDIRLQAPLDLLVVSAVRDVATPRAEISEPRPGLMETASLCDCPSSGHAFEVVAAPRVGADVPRRAVAVIAASMRAGSAV